MRSVTHRALILALIASLLWPWAAAAATCDRHAAKASDCCATSCCCEGEAAAAACGCCAEEAPAEAPERAPIAPATGSHEIDRVLDLAPTIDLRASGASTSTRDGLGASRVTLADGGRAVLRRGCRLRH